MTWNNLTRRGKNLVIVLYTILMTLLLVMVWQKYDVDCVDKYTADILATQFLYGEGEDVDRALTAIYNNGGWENINELGEVEIIFPCLKNEGLV
jgi:hypothetical protein